MKQSRLASFIEQCLNTASGFALSLIAQWLVLPWLMGVPIAFTANLAFAAIMTVVSIGRGYLWRRLMEALHVRRPLSPFAQAVIAERFRQQEVEGWDVKHDDAHEDGELARAGAAYAINARSHLVDTKGKGIFTLVAQVWPWSPRWWKPTEFRRDLVKAGALIIAEGEKFDRHRKDERGVWP